MCAFHFCKMEITGREFLVLCAHLCRFQCKQDVEHMEVGTRITVCNSNPFFCGCVHISLFSMGIDIFGSRIFTKLRVASQVGLNQKPMPGFPPNCSQQKPIQIKGFYFNALEAPFPVAQSYYNTP